MNKLQIEKSIRLSFTIALITGLSLLYQTSNLNALEFPTNTRDVVVQGLEGFNNAPTQNNDNKCIITTYNSSGEVEKTYDVNSISNSFVIENITTTPGFETNKAGIKITGNCFESSELIQIPPGNEDDYILNFDTQKFGNEYYHLGIDNIKQYAESQNIRAKEINIGLLDTGYNFEQPFIKENIRNGRVFTNAPDFNCTNRKAINTNDSFNHGTKTLGYLLQNTPKGTKIYPAPIYSNGNCDIDQISVYDAALRGLKWFRDNSEQYDINIVLVEIQDDYSNPEVETVIKELYNSGVLVIVTAGNYGLEGGSTSDNSFAASDYSLSVGAVTPSGQIYPYSNNNPDIVAISGGLSISGRSTNDNMNLINTTYGGTSMAAPSAAIAIANSLAFVDSYISPKEIIDLLSSSKLNTDIDKNGYERDGYGEINGWEFYKAAANI